jgi:hypothetical protein
MVILLVALQHRAKEIQGLQGGRAVFKTVEVVVVLVQPEVLRL